MKKLALIVLALMPIMAFGQVKITMEQKDGVFYVPCKVNGLDLKFIFDTGASDVVISATEATFMLKNGFMQESDIVGSTYSQIANGEIIEGTKIIIRKIEIAGLTLSNVSAAVVHEMKAPLLLGMSAIKQLGEVKISGNELSIGKMGKTKEQIAETNVQYGEGVVINGVIWATRNVDEVGTFAYYPESEGKFYQWNRKVAYHTTDDISNFDSSFPRGISWAKDNDPSPKGWRVPTADEIKSLLDTIRVKNEWTKQKGVYGRRFTDKSTGASIFLPAVGGRNFRDGTLFYEGRYGYYWSSEKSEDNYQYYLEFYSNNAFLTTNTGGRGHSVRCVAE